MHGPDLYDGGSSGMEEKSSGRLKEPAVQARHASIMPA